MTEQYKKSPDMNTDQRVELAKETSMIFPGITKVYLTRE